MTPVSIQLQSLKPLRGTPSAEASLDDALKLQQAYRDFVGKTFFGQMLKSMRSTVGEPAYFSGGRAEETFRTQLDQHFADAMSEASAPQIADPMFRRQFPQQAAVIDQADAAQSASLADLQGLRRR